MTQNPLFQVSDNFDVFKCPHNNFYLKIQYFELRNANNFKISNKIKNSKIFVAFFIDKVRLIDNF